MKALHVRFDSEEPVEIQLPHESEENSLEQMQALVGGNIEYCPYPLQLKRDGLAMYLNEEGIYNPLPYNRWGIVGNFVIFRPDGDADYIDLSDADIATIKQDLKTSKGLLDDDCPTLTPFKEVFARYGEPPLGCVPPGVKANGAWFSQ